MGICAHLEVENREFLVLANGLSNSKAIATFLTPPLMCYCELQNADRELKEVEKEIIEWISTITARMGEDLCLLARITYGFWDYTEGEYKQYFDTEKEIYKRAKNSTLPSWLETRPGADEAVQAARSREFEVLSEEEFVKVCKEYEQKWATIDLVKNTIDDFIKVVDEIHPPETWWYNEEDSLTDFRLFSKALFRAIETGYKRVRIYLS